MALIEFKNKPDTTTPINATNLNYNFNEILNLIFPIGRGFIDFTETDYSNWLGFSWERELLGLTPIGYNPNDEDFNEIGKTMGEKTHTLTINEMPSHTHNANLSATTDTGISRLITSDWSWNTKNQQNSGLINSSGGGQAHNNIQPSQVVAYWRRVA